MNIEHNNFEINFNKSIKVHVHQFVICGVKAI